ncbi:MAG: hypothetical protein GY910_22900 [bacterium]|nr:hypothetical protein [bacterium]
MRVAAGFFVALFVVGALVQLNDPDPIPWIAGYAIASVLSLAAALGRPHRIANAVAAILFGIWFVSLAPSLIGAPQEAFTSFEMQAVFHEEPREAGGLALLSSWSAALAYWAGRRETSERQDSAWAGADAG